MTRATKLSALAAVGISLLLVGHALAVHDPGLFQLDYVTNPAQGAANVSSTNISPSGNTGDDWDMVYAGTTKAFASGFIADGVRSAETSFFTGGGSKDTNDIPQWLYDTVNDVVPDKDDIEHAFAAAYDRPSDSGKGQSLRSQSRKKSAWVMGRVSGLATPASGARSGSRSLARLASCSGPGR